jgi:hypothetical protein
MNRPFVSLTTAAALAAGTVLTPTQASAYPVWVIPAIIGAGAIGIGAGAAAANAPRGVVTVVEQPGTGYDRPAVGVRAKVVVGGRAAVTSRTRAAVGAQAAIAPPLRATVRGEPRMNRGAKNIPPRAAAQYWR